MTNYSIDSNVRRKAHAWTVFLAIILAFTFNAALSSKTASFFASLPAISWMATVGIVGTVSAFAFYGILWAAFDRYLWKARPFSFWLQVPDLSGHWVGSYESSYMENGERKKGSIEFHIKQTFTAMSYCGIADKSKTTCANTIGILNRNPTTNSCILEVSYRNSSDCAGSAHDPSLDNDYPGFNMLSIEGDTMVGRYCTFRNVPTFGTIKAERKSA